MTGVFPSRSVPFRRPRYRAFSLRISVGPLAGQHHHVGLGKGNQRSADNALDVLFAVQMFRFRHNLETNGNVDEEKQPTGKPIQMLNSNTPDYQKTRYHD